MHYIFMVLIYLISESRMRASAAAGAHPPLPSLKFSTLQLQISFCSLGLITDVIIMKIMLAPGIVLIYTINIVFYT